MAQIVAQNQNAASLSKLENDVLAEQVRHLHGAVQVLSDTNSLRELIQQNVQQHEAQFSLIHDAKEKVQFDCLQYLFL